MVSYSNSNGKSRILGAEKIEVISTENDFAGVYSILTICHICICILPLRTGLRVVFPCFILRELFGNNLGADMLEQYGDFGTN